MHGGSVVAFFVGEGCVVPSLGLSEWQCPRRYEPTGDYKGHAQRTMLQPRFNPRHHGNRGTTRDALLHPNPSALQVAALGEGHRGRVVEVLQRDLLEERPAAAVSRGEPYRLDQLTHAELIAA